MFLISIIVDIILIIIEMLVKRRVTSKENHGLISVLRFKSLLVSD